MSATVESIGELYAVLGAVELGHGSPLNSVQWEAVPAVLDGGYHGWLLRLSFTRPDRNTGELGRGASRWEFIGSCATESAVVKTAWLLCELTVRHEPMEAFTYAGVRIFDPHHTVAELSLPARSCETEGIR